MKNNYSCCTYNCQTYGCGNNTNNSVFIGNLCQPCYEALTDGDLGYFLNRFKKGNGERELKMRKYEEAFNKMKDVIDSI